MAVLRDEATRRRTGGSQWCRRSTSLQKRIVFLLLVPALACALVAFLSSLGPDDYNTSSISSLVEQLISSSEYYSADKNTNNATAATPSSWLDNGGEEHRRARGRQQKRSKDGETGCLSPSGGGGGTRGTSSSFFSRNSREWLDGPRYGNINSDDDPSVNDEFARRMVLDYYDLSSPTSATTAGPLKSSGGADAVRATTAVDFLLKQSLCHSNSRFVNGILDGEWPSWQRLGNDDGDNPPPPPDWVTAVLVYLSLHLFQHRPAIPEAQIKLLGDSEGSPCRHRNRQDNDDVASSTGSDTSVGPYDYECPDAKFLVVRLYHNGIGANMRLGAVPAFWAGLSLNRIVIFVNNLPASNQTATTAGNEDYLRVPWKLVSCQRQDHQCFFLPTTPCVLTHQELSNAYILTKNAMRHVFRTGKLSATENGHGDDRVIIMKLTFRPQRQPNHFRHVLYNLSQSVIGQLTAKTASPTSSLRPWLLKAADRILRQDGDVDDGDNKKKESKSFNYYGVNSPAFHGILLYAMRPNPKSHSAINNILDDIISSNDRFDPSNSLGLPIRASDKCDVESECFSLGQYVQAATRIWAEHHHTRSNANSTSVVASSLSANITAANIVVTSESKVVLRDLANYLASDKKAEPSPFPLRFVTNHHDVLQSTGYMDEIIDRSGQDDSLSADDAMLSAISSLKLQLATKVTTGNCCSNFHLLLKDFLDSGCGAVREDSTFLCLQDHPDPEFRPCCSWDKSQVCQQRRSRSRNDTSA